MNELYSKDRVQYFHQAYIAEDNPFGVSVYKQKDAEITDAEFKQLLVSMPARDTIYHYNRSFKIAKDEDSLRISIFDFKKKSNHRFKKHQLEKELLIMRYIIKFNSNNFYVSTTRFGNRKRKKDIKQNFIRNSHIKIFVSRMVDLLVNKSSWTWEGVEFKENVAIPQETMNEIVKITSVLFNELDVPTTMKAIPLPTSVGKIQKYFEELFMGVILEWFARKNNIKVDYFWLTKLISVQYMTKRQLKKYDNNYLKAFLDYYKLSPAVVPHIKSNIDNYVGKQLDFVTLSVYEKLFPKDEYFFNYEMNTLPNLESEINPMLTIKTYLGSIFKLYDPKDRAEFEGFLNYLSANRKHFRTYPVVNHLNHLGSFIRATAKLYRMGVHFDFGYTPDFMASGKKIAELTDAVDNLAQRGNAFMVQHYSKKYKSKIESEFSLYGIKWSIKLHAKTTFNGGASYGDFIVHNTSALLTRLDTGEILELSFLNPNAKEYVAMNVDEESLSAYFSVREPINLDMEALGFKNFSGNPLKSFTKFAGQPKVITRKSPKDGSAVIWALRKVYNTFNKNCRYFDVDNQILFPILDKIIKDGKLPTHAERWDGL